MLVASEQNSMNDPRNSIEKILYFLTFSKPTCTADNVEKMM